MIVSGMILVLASLFFDEGESKLQNKLTDLCLWAGVALLAYGLIRIFI